MNSGETKTKEGNDKEAEKKEESGEAGLKIKEREEAKEQKAHEGEQEDIKSLKNKLKKREAEIKGLKKTKEELIDKYFRALAEMENLKKRLVREKNEYYQFALSEFLKELLQVLDNFERALRDREQTDGKSFQEGVEMIYKQFLDILSKKGIAPIVIENKKFDPNFHQAILTEESDQVKEPEVEEELQKGYTLHDRLLRPSFVRVIIPKKT